MWGAGALFDSIGRGDFDIYFCILFFIADALLADLQTTLQANGTVDSSQHTASQSYQYHNSQPSDYDDQQVSRFFISSADFVVIR